MKQNILLFAMGMLIGIVLMSFMDRNQGKTKQTKYIELKENFYLSNGGVLKRGTQLKIDKSSSEGFTRYILYVNYKSEEGIGLKSYEKMNLVKPYWIYRDSAAVNN
ncbi:hypothetical protein V9K67_03935 [Paraflavisolibacter sp. H34]|uniref:hypothetical protein n=1 Tax=Huijunlia imazamoxiresistens TaxID=3127457 RepID=UPI0030175536